MNLAELTFPILGIEGTTAMEYPNATYLAVVGKGALASGFLERLEVIDSSGRSYRISSYRAKRQWWWQRPRTPVGRGVAVENILVEPTGEVDLVQLKGKITACVQADRELWEAAEDADAILSRVSAATNHREAITALFERHE